MSAAELPKVLIVDDERANRHVLSMMLRRLGHACEAVCDGQEAVERFEVGSDFGMVVMDLQMPRLDGFAATREIRHLLRGRHGYVPIVALTAAPTDEIRRRAFEAGVDDFLTKPIDLATLRSKLSMWIDTEPSVPPPARADAVPSPAALDMTVLEEEAGFEARVLQGLIDLGADGDQSIAVTTVQLVLAELSGQTTGMADALAQMDPRALHASAHRLCGAARNVGAVRLADLCLELEQCSRRSLTGGPEQDRIAGWVRQVAAEATYAGQLLRRALRGTR